MKRHIDTIRIPSWTDMLIPLDCIKIEAWEKKEAMIQKGSVFISRKSKDQKNDFPLVSYCLNSFLVKMFKNSGACRTLKLCTAAMFSTIQALKVE